jgi:hypothetical protein
VSPFSAYGISCSLPRIARTPFEDLNALVVIERRVGAPKPSRLRYLVGLIGCGMAGFVVLFVLIAGVRAIVGWMR